MFGTIFKRIVGCFVCGEVFQSLYRRPGTFYLPLVFQTEVSLLGSNNRPLKGTPTLTTEQV